MERVTAQAVIDRINANRVIDTERYAEDGYSSRFDYLAGLAEESDVPLEGVIELAEMLGPNEDFDGLVTTIEDHEDEMREAWP
jgi:hypothetical protein